jgi:hypothetical protein
MPILTAVVVVVGGLCLLDLLLTFGVIRRLREHTSRLAGVRVEPPLVGLAAGRTPGGFSAVTTFGEEVTGAAGLRVVAFFSSGCSTCPERVPPFLEYLSRHHIGRDSVLAVVAADKSLPAPYLEQLEEVALACVEPPSGEIATAFEVAGFPAFFLLTADGVVAVNGYDPATLPEPATV